MINCADSDIFSAHLANNPSHKQNIGRKDTKISEQTCSFRLTWSRVNNEILVIAVENIDRSVTNLKSSDCENEGIQKRGYFSMGSLRREVGDHVDAHQQQMKLALPQLP